MRFSSPVEEHLSPPIPARNRKWKADDDDGRRDAATSGRTTSGVASKKRIMQRKGESEEDTEEEEEEEERLETRRILVDSRPASIGSVCEGDP